MNASNVLFLSDARGEQPSLLGKALRERAAGLAVVVVVHVVLCAALVYAMHGIMRPVSSDVTVRLIDAPKPLPVQDPVPMPVAKTTVQIAMPHIDLPVPPAVETPVPPTPTVATVPAVMQTVTAIKPSAAPPSTSSGDSAPLVDASAAGNAKPVYPRASKALGEQGVVVLDVYVTTEGTVGDIRVDHSSGFDRLDESALRAVRQWHFVPARQGGKQVAMWYKQPITFDLKSA